MPDEQKMIIGHQKGRDTKSMFIEIWNVQSRRTAKHA